MSYFVVSDVHDHYDLLMAALKKQGFDKENPAHTLVLCGDAFYSGPQPGELFVFLRELWNRKQLILIRGNHDYELLENLKSGGFKRPANRTCAELLVGTLTGKHPLTDRELITECENTGFTDFLDRVPVWYYETEHYIFTHAFLPTEHHTYRPDWRSATETEWRTAASHGDAMALTMKYGIREPGKTIVCGHYSAARCWLMRNATSADWENKIYKDVSKVPPEGFLPFISDSMIALDASTKKTGWVNCIILY